MSVDRHCICLTLQELVESGHHDTVPDEFFVFEKDRVSFEDVSCAATIDDAVAEASYNCQVIHCRLQSHDFCLRN